MRPLPPEDPGTSLPRVVDPGDIADMLVELVQSAASPSPRPRGRLGRQALLWLVALVLAMVLTVLLVFAWRHAV
jgi:hypothetical protein